MIPERLTPKDILDRAAEEQRAAMDAYYHAAYRHDSDRAAQKRLRNIALVAYLAVFAAVLWAFVHWNANIDRLFDQIDRSIGLFR